MNSNIPATTFLFQLYNPSKTTWWITCNWFKKETLAQGFCCRFSKRFNFFFFFTKYLRATNFDSESPAGGLCPNIFLPHISKHSRQRHSKVTFIKWGGGKVSKTQFFLWYEESQLPT